MGYYKNTFTESMDNHLADAFGYMAQGWGKSMGIGAKEYGEHIHKSWEQAMGSNVESPEHYTQGYMEVIYEIHDTLGREGFKAFCMGNWMKYNARANHKGLKSEDLAKADQYLEWATNGLPSPVNNRVPRAPKQHDLYEQFAEQVFKRGPDITEERTVAKSSVLGAGYGTAASQDKGASAPKDGTTPRAKTIANAIGPYIEKAFGQDIMTKIRLRVTKNRSTCDKHGSHIYYVVYVYDREDSEIIAAAFMLSEEPDEVECKNVADALIDAIKHYLS